MNIDQLLLDEIPAAVRNGRAKLAARIEEAEAAGDPKAERLRAILADIDALESTIRIELTGDDGRDYFYNQSHGELSVADTPASDPVAWITLSRSQADALLAYATSMSGGDRKSGGSGGKLGRLFKRSIVDAIGGLNKVLKFVVTGFPDVDDDLEVLLRLGPSALGSEPAMTLTVAYDTLEKLAARQLTAPQAFMMGLFKIDGDMSMVMQLASFTAMG